MQTMTELFKPINERITVRYRTQKWAARHAFTLTFLAIFGILAWLTMLTVAVIELYV